jgi:hypothetical protein
MGLETAAPPLLSQAGDQKSDPTLHQFSTETQASFADFKTLQPDDPDAVASAGSTPVVSSSQMSSKHWNEVLVANALLNGFSVDSVNSNIKRVRKTASRLLPNPINPTVTSPGTLSSHDVDKIRALAHPAVQETRALLAGIPAPTSTAAAHPPGSNSQGRSKLHGPAAASPSSSNFDDTTDLSGALLYLNPIWQSCDDSSTTVETLQTSMQQASADQAFSSEAVEASVSVSAMGFSGSASAGFATSPTTARADAESQQKYVMHAVYELPRVRLFLDGETSTVSDDCASALANIQQYEDYDGPVRFYRDFGTVFVTQARLGGRLRATKQLNG